MTENIENLVLEQLHAIRNDIATLKTEVHDKFDMLTQRVSSVEIQVAQLNQSVALIHGDVLGIHVRLIGSTRAWTATSGVWNWRIHRSKSWSNC